jgi:hypothetical protein
MIQSITIVKKGAAPSFGAIGYNGSFWGWVLALFCWQVPQP